jgi:ferritin-like metal-binding protein YciE
MQLHSFFDALQECVCQLLGAEQQSVQALEHAAEIAGNHLLKDLLSEHAQQTRQQITRLERICQMLDIPAEPERSRAVEGLIEDAKMHMDGPDDADPDVIDAVIIGAAQKLEHFEICAYGTACAWAEAAGLPRVADLLRQTLAEEKLSDERFTRIAESSINRQAANV